MTKTADPVRREDKKNGTESSIVPSQVTNPVDFTVTTVSSVSFGDSAGYMLVLKISSL